MSAKTPLQTENTKFVFTSEDWDNTPASVQEAFLLLLNRVVNLEEKVANLEEQLKRNSGNSSQPPSQDGPEKAVLKKSEKSARKRGGQPGHPGAKRTLVPLELVKESHDIKPTHCGHCDSALTGDDPNPYRHQVVEIPPVVAEVTEYRLHTCTCQQCGRKTRALLPDGVPTGAFGPRIEAMVGLLSGQYHLSKREIERMMATFFEVPISLGAISRVEKRCEQAIATPVKDAEAYVRQQAVVHMDETGWREENKKAWLWVAATPGVAVFQIWRSRGSQVAKALLGEAYAGRIVSDRWSAYNWFDKRRRQLCWAHLKRDFQAISERKGPSQIIGEDLLQQKTQLFTLWRQVCEGALSRSDFIEKTKPIRDEVGRLLREGKLCDPKKTAGTCRHILRFEPALWTFIYVPGIEPTNNFAERQIRPAVLWRKSSFGTQSKAGSRFVQSLMTVVATLKLQKRNPFDYLVAAIDAANKDGPAPSLLPQ
jgi:transposase